MGSFNMKDIEILSEFFNLPINELKDLKEKLVYKREFENAIFLNKLLTIN